MDLTSICALYISRFFNVEGAQHTDPRRAVYELCFDVGRTGAGQIAGFYTAQDGLCVFSCAVRDI
jgi:hypothetical protein